MVYLGALYLVLFLGNLFSHLSKLVKLSLHLLSILVLPRISIFLYLKTKRLWMRILYVALFTGRIMPGVVVWNYASVKHVHKS